MVVDEPSYVSYYSPLARFIWTILGIINALLAIRFILKLLAANPAAGFTNFIYAVTSPLVAPFQGVIRTSSAGGSTFEWFTLLAMVIYWLVAWAIVRLATVSRPMARY
ncbi:MAG: YggT family protein [Candidatus Doudnabacteria bacterium]|nr:YggT family protein [Candidatus Doudnabacteria bacterium]